MAPELTSENPLKKWLSGLTEQTFEVEYGIADPPLIDYLTDMLVRFVRLDAVFAIRDEVGRRLDQVVDMLREAECREAEPRREVHRHIGDFTLFWSGMYPESLRKIRAAGSADGFLDYCSQGKRAYRIAAQIEGGEGPPPSELLLRLSEQFELCAYGLREVRREWEENEGGEVLIL
jgi:hypothetical protein